MIIPAYSSQLDLTTLSLDDLVNGGKPIRYLVSAPTMRIPMDVSKTVNAYLAFRGIIRAGGQQLELIFAIFYIICIGFMMVRKYLFSVQV